MRMNQIFSGLIANNTVSFYTKNDQKKPSLHFFFDNGIDPYPEFSGPVKGEIYLEGHNIYLEIEPFQKKASSSYRKELLFSGADELSFLFLAKKDEKFPNKEAKSINSSIEWRPTWSKEKAALPSLIRLEMLESVSEKEQKPQNLLFAFYLPQQDIPVTY